MSTTCGRPQGGEGVWLMWTEGRGSKVRFFLDVINGWSPMADASIWCIQSIRERYRSLWCACRVSSSALVETSSDDGEGVQLLLGILITTRWKLVRRCLIVWQPANCQPSPGQFQPHRQAFASRLLSIATWNSGAKISSALNRKQGIYLHWLTL